MASEAKEMTLEAVPSETMVAIGELVESAYGLGMVNGSGSTFFQGGRVYSKAELEQRYRFALEVVKALLEGSEPEAKLGTDELESQ